MSYSMKSFPGPVSHDDPKWEKILGSDWNKIINGEDYGYYAVKENEEDIRCYPYIPHYYKDVIDILKEINFRKGKFLDVGCGAGHILHAVKNFRKKIQCYGIEYVPEVAKYANTLPEVETVFNEDALKFANYGDYDVIYLYKPIADSKGYSLLIKKIWEQMKEGAYLIQMLDPMFPFSHDLYKKQIAEFKQKHPDKIDQLWRVNYAQAETVLQKRKNLTWNTKSIEIWYSRNEIFNVFNLKFSPPPSDDNSVCIYRIKPGCITKFRKENSFTTIVKIKFSYYEVDTLEMEYLSFAAHVYYSQNPNLKDIRSFSLTKEIEDNLFGWYGEE